MLNWLKNLLGGSKSATTHRLGGTTTMPAKASMSMASRRCTGRYTCGCEGDLSVLLPQACPDHPDGYLIYEAWNDHGAQYEEIVNVPATMFEEG